MNIEIIINASIKTKSSKEDWENDFLKWLDERNESFLEGSISTYHEEENE